MGAAQTEHSIIVALVAVAVHQGGGVEDKQPAYSEGAILRGGWLFLAFGMVELPVYWRSDGDAIQVRHIISWEAAEAGSLYQVC